MQSCKENSTNTPALESNLFPEKDIQFDSNGDIISSDIDLLDFHSSDNCIGCHAEYVEEWKLSMHAYSMRDPVFFSGWKLEQSKHHETGERFCIQCHSPVAYVTGKKLDEYTNVSELQNDPDLSVSIKEGVTCTVCHSFTGVSKTVDAGYNVAAVADYHMNPGEGIIYGPIESPVEIEPSENSYAHESEYNPLFRSSESCLPCHDFIIRGVDAEITYSEWNDDIPEFFMAGLVSCQECHMPVITRQVAAIGPVREAHQHTFVGVDIDLTQEIPEDSIQYQSVEKLLQSSIVLEFGGLIAEDTIKIENGVLSIPVTVKSLTGHSLPSGTSFAREAWLETIVTDTDQNTIYSSGTIEWPISNLDLSDTNLVLFTSYLLDSDGDTTTSVTDAFDIIPQMLPGLRSQVHKYEISEDFSEIDELSIRVRMRFRAFKPFLLEGEHSALLARQPVFDMALIDTTLTIP